MRKDWFVTSVLQGQMEEKDRPRIEHTNDAIVGYSWPRSVAVRPAPLYTRHEA